MISLPGGDGGPDGFPYTLPPLASEVVMCRSCWGRDGVMCGGDGLAVRRVTGDGMAQALHGWPSFREAALVSRRLQCAGRSAAVSGARAPMATTRRPAAGRDAAQRRRGQATLAFACAR